MRAALYEQDGFPRGEQDYAAGEHGKFFSISWAVAARVKVPLTNDRARSRRTSPSACWGRNQYRTSLQIASWMLFPVRRCGA